MIKVISSNTTKPRTRTFIEGACGFLATNIKGESVICVMQEYEESVVIFEEGYCLRVETFDSDTTLEDWCDGKEYAFIRTLPYSNNFRITVEILP
jgi:hypothetical protein